MTSPTAERIEDRLLPQHLADLRASGLSDETIAECGFYSVTDSAEVARLLRWKDVKRAAALGACLAIPFREPDGRPTDYVRLKPDRPRVKGGRTVKYESPRGLPNRAFVPPGTRAALADPTVPLILTEGEKKSAKASEDGFACVGLVGVYGWARKREKTRDGKKLPFALIADLERVAWSGRTVCLGYDSDLADKPEVQWAGWKLCEVLSGFGAVVRSVRLPPGSDGQKVGLDDFLLANGPAALKTLIDAAGPTPRPARSRRAGQAAGSDPPGAGPAPDPAATLDVFQEDHDNPHRLADLILADPQLKHPDGPLLRYWMGEFAQWIGGAYRRLPAADFRARVAERVRTQLVQDAKADFLKWLRTPPGERGKVPKAKKVTKNLVGDVQQALGGRTLIRADVEPPAWLTEGAGPPAGELLAAPNGLIHLPAVAAGAAGGLLRPTPAFFTFNRLPFDFDPAARPPARWLAFLNTLWADSPDTIDCLQEWLGYLLTSDTSQQKILMLVGPKRAGKGTILTVIRHLVGAENCAAPTLGSLSSNFGLQPLLGKTVALVGDARITERVDTAVLTERLLSISGEDALTVDRKYLDPVTVRLLTRFVIATNELPSLRDASGALVSRMVVLRFTESFYDREDKGLKPALLAELPGILLWAIAGWKRLRDRGRFVQPGDGAEEVQEMEDLASPIGAFVREECVTGLNEWVVASELYQVWKAYCEANERRAGSPQMFGRNLRAAFPKVTKHRPRRRGDRRGDRDAGHDDQAAATGDQTDRPNCYFGIRLKRCGPKLGGTFRPEAGPVTTDGGSGHHGGHHAGHNGTPGKHGRSPRSRRRGKTIAQVNRAARHGHHPQQPRGRTDLIQRTVFTGVVTMVTDRRPPATPPRAAFRPTTARSGRGVRDDGHPRPRVGRHPTRRRRPLRAGRGRVRPGLRPRPPAGPAPGRPGAPHRYPGAADRPPMVRHGRERPRDRPRPGRGPKPGRPDPVRDGLADSGTGRQV